MMRMQAMADEGRWRLALKSENLDQLLLRLPLWPRSRRFE